MPPAKAPNMGNEAQKSAAASETWSEERIEEGLEQLKLLHVKCRGLRSTIPNVLEPLSHSNHSAAQSTSEIFSAAVKTAISDINNFKALYTSSESKVVLDQARRSRESHPKGIKQWRARDHPDWLELDVAKRPLPETSAKTEPDSH